MPRKDRSFYDRTTEILREQGHLNPVNALESERFRAAMKHVLQQPHPVKHPDPPHPPLDRPNTKQKRNAGYRPVSESAVVAVIPDAVLVRSNMRWEIHSGDKTLGMSTASGGSAWNSAAMRLGVSKACTPVVKPSKVLPAGRNSFKLPSHAWCSQCNRVEQVVWEGINRSSVDQDFEGGDIVCETCSFVIATLYVPWMTPEEPKCGDCMVVHGKSVCTMNCGPVARR
jgi:hypothetical protein